MTTPAVSGAEIGHVKVCVAATANELTPQFVTEALMAHSPGWLESVQVPEGPTPEGLPIVVVNAPAEARYCVD